MLKVVIADDEYYILKELENIIDWNKIGCEIVGKAKNGREAKELVRTLQANILITDIKMPFVDGLSLIQDLCEHDKKIEFIIISGYSDFSYALQGIKFGVSDYLLKPIESTELMNAVKKIVNKKEGFSLHNEENPIMEQAAQTNRYIKKALEYVEKNYASALNLQEVADSLSISSSYLSKLFVDKLEMRFTQFVNLYRIKISQHYLKSTDKTIEEIASIVGYNDYKYFSQVFKTVSGMTPMQYKSETSYYVNS
ncbi:MAG: response regulator [Spirochaetia bacterium]|nr:response regulator [Spirochaetia bacterium]